MFSPVRAFPCVLSPRNPAAPDTHALPPRVPAGVCTAAAVVDAMQMTQYYTHSVCTPARASLMTGRYVVRYGMQYNIIDTGATWGLPLSEKVRLGTALGCSPRTDRAGQRGRWWCRRSSGQRKSQHRDACDGLIRQQGFLSP